MPKRTLVLLPGLLNDHRLFQHQISNLADVVALNVADLSKANSMAELASYVLDEAPPEQFALAGLSMGGYLALEIMRQAPTRVSALALLDTNARADTPESTANRKALIELSETDFPEVIEKLIPKLVHPEQLDDEHQIETIRAMATKLGKDVFKRQQEAIMSRIDSRPFLGEIKCPTLILCGADDLITPIEVHQEMHDAIPNSMFRIIPRCGHLSTLGQPEEVTTALREWLALDTSQE